MWLKRPRIWIWGSIIAGGLICVEPALAQPNAPNPPTVPLCELFKDLRSYAGKLVSVRGQLYGGFEVSALGAHCNDKFISKYSPSPLLPEPQFDYVWPTALNLAMSAFAASQGATLNFSTDAATVDQVYSQVRRLRAKFGNQAEIWVTVVGMVQVKEYYGIGKGGGWEDARQRLRASFGLSGSACD